MKKVILIILLTFFCCGCTINYEISISGNDKVTETIELLNLNNETIEFLSNNKTVYEEKYNMQITDNSATLIRNYNSIEKYIAETDALDYFSINKNENKLTATTTYEQIFINYAQLNDGDDIIGYKDTNNFVLNVIVKGNKKIIASNYNKKQAGEYIWEFTDLTIDNKIYFEIQDKNNSWIYFLLLIILAGLIYLIYKKAKKNNSI